MRDAINARIMALGWRTILFVGAQALTSVLFASSAFAQTAPTIKVNTETVRQIAAGGGDAAKHNPSSLELFKINRQDCLDDNLLRVPITLSDATLPANSFNFQVWAGTEDCSLPDARDATPTCWQVYGGGNPTVAQSNIDIPVRNIVAHFSASRPVPTTATYSKAPESVCAPIPKDTRGQTTVTLYFLWLTTTTAAKQATYAATLDIFGPEAPSVLDPGVDNTRLVAKWKPASNTDTSGYRVYCVKTDNCNTNPGVIPGAPDTGTVDTPDVGVADAADGGDGSVPEQPVDAATEVDAATGVDAATTGTADASTSALRVAPEFLCGEVNSPLAGEAVISSIGNQGLQNNESYEIAVAAVDRFGNVGDLSTPVCAIPRKTTDFWDSYRENGGQAGGDCNSSGGKNAAGSLPLLGGVVVGLRILRRRRKERA